MMEWSNWFTAATVVFTSVIVWKWFRTKKSSKNTGKSFFTYSMDLNFLNSISLSI